MCDIYAQIELGPLSLTAKGNTIHVLTHPWMQIISTRFLNCFNITTKYILHEIMECLFCLKWDQNLGIKL